RKTTASQSTASCSDIDFGREVIRTHKASVESGALGILLIVPSLATTWPSKREPFPHMLLLLSGNSPSRNCHSLQDLPAQTRVDPNCRANHGSPCLRCTRRQLIRTSMRCSHTTPADGRLLSAQLLQG